MRLLNIAISVIEQDGKYHLQLRNGDPKIGGAGLIGCFGGKIKDGETSAVAASRELAEETSLRPKHHDLEYLGEVKVESDHQLEPVRVVAQVHKLVVDSAADIEALEGELVSMTLDEIKQSLDRLTTGTRACFEELVFQED